MSNPLQFLHARIGRVDEWTVRAKLVAGTLPASTAHAAQSFRRWVKLDDERGQLYAQLDAAKLELHFASRSAHRQVQRSLPSWSRPFACYVELSGAADSTLEGSLFVMRTALPTKLAAAPTIVIPTKLLDEIEQGRRPSLQELAHAAVLPSGLGPLLVVTTPLLLGTAATDGAPVVQVHLHNRWTLQCEITGLPGRQYLMTTRIEREGHTSEIPDGRLVALPAAPVVVGEAAQVAGTDLSPLQPVRHEVIEAWIAYEQLERDQRLQDLSRRLAHPLEYTEVDAQQAREKASAFHVILSQPQLVTEHWLDPKVVRQWRAVQVRVPVTIIDLDDRQDAASGELLEFRDVGDGRLDAVLRLEDGRRTPPVRGRIIAIADRKEQRQRERRKRALDRLRRGTGANPELLGWLLNPRSIPELTLARDPGRHRLGHLDSHQRRAVGLATQTPSLVLVQGPPGAGKTTVIRSILDELRRRRAPATTGDRRPGDEGSSLRVLVSSTQNEAVRNAVEKLSDDAGLEVWVMGDKDESANQRLQLAERAKRIAAELWNDLRDAPRFLAYERVRRLHDSLVRLRATLYETGMGPILLHRLQELAAAEEASELTALLRSQLPALAARLAAALKPPDDEPPRLVSEPPTPLAAAVASLGVAQRLDVATWPQLAAGLARLAECMTRPSKQDGALLELCERWLDWQRRLRRESARGFSAESLAAVATLWTETAAALAVQSQPVAPPRAVAAPISDELCDDLHAWVQRACSLAEATLSAREEQEEAALSRWHRTLSEEPGRLAELVERHAILTAATCQRADSARGDEEPAEFDVVIIDEAARAGIDVLIPMALGRSIILVGDHRQLPPHIEHELEAQLEQGLRERVDLKRESLFSWLWHGMPRSNIVSLARQYRMHADVGRAISRLFYEPELILEHNHTTRSTFDVCGNQPLVWIDTADVLQLPARRAEHREQKWPCDEENHYEAALIVQLIARANREELLGWHRETGKKPIGVIPFYGRQRDLIAELIRSRLDPPLAELIQLGTVDSFQGREFPLVFLSTVRSNLRGFVGFLRLPNRVNVAISRAQRQVILLGDSRTLAARGAGSEELGQLYAELLGGQLCGRVLQSAEVVR